MKNIFLLIAITLLITGCNERESKEANEESVYKSKYDIVDTSKFENQKSKIDPYGILDITYAVIVSQQGICDILENTFKESENKDLLKEYMMPQLEKCKFYREVYKKVIPNFESVNLDNANKYYYFNYSDENSDTTFSNIIGIFSNIDNCNKAKEEFLDKEMGLTSKCKNIELIKN
jgi:uncharacterized protein YceK